MNIQTLYDDCYNNPKGSYQEYSPECELQLVDQLIKLKSKNIIILIHFKQLNDLIMHTQIDIRQVSITFGKGVTGTIMVR